MIFNIQIKYMWFFNFFWKHNLFIWALLLWTIFASCYFCYRPSERLVVDTDGIK